MKRTIVTCPCGETVIWSKDMDDGEKDFSIVEGVGDTQPCCSEDKNPTRREEVQSFDQAMRGVQKRRKGQKKAR